MIYILSLLLKNEEYDRLITNGYENIVCTSLNKVNKEIIVL